jgi:hypothetical protein
VALATCFSAGPSTGTTFFIANEPAGLNSFPDAADHVPQELLQFPVVLNAQQLQCELELLLLLLLWQFADLEHFEFEVCRGLTAARAVAVHCVRHFFLLAPLTE